MNMLNDIEVEKTVAKNMSNQPEMKMVGKDVSVLAERDGFPVLVRQGHLLAATFHPELSTDRRVHGYFVDMVREASDRARGANTEHRES